MSKYLLSAAAAAFLMVGSSAAWAVCPSGSEGLPNANWSWGQVGGGDPIVTTDITNIGPLSFSGNSGNATADVTTVTTTTTPGFTCQAVNPGGNVVDSKSFSTEPTVVESNPVTENIKVCQNVGQGGSEPLIVGVDCTN